jgi:hypothetical protein
MFYLPAERMEGDLNLSSGTYEFQGCNFIASGEAARVLGSVAGDNWRTYQFRVKMIARRTPPRAPELGGFGHLMRQFSCQIEAVRFISIEEIPQGR